MKVGDADGYGRYGIVDADADADADAEGFCVTSAATGTATSVCTCGRPTESGPRTTGPSTGCAERVSSLRTCASSWRPMLPAPWTIGPCS